MGYDVHFPHRNGRGPPHQEREEVQQGFSLAYGHPTPATNIAKLGHIVQEPACTVNILPALSSKSLLSGGNFVEAGYVSICNGDKVNIYNGCTSTITVSDATVLKGCWCPHTKLSEPRSQASTCTPSSSMDPRDVNLSTPYTSSQRPQNSLIT